MNSLSHPSPIVGSGGTKNPAIAEKVQDPLPFAGKSSEAVPGQTEAPKNRLPDIPVSQVRHVKSQEELTEVLKAHLQWVEQVLDPDVEVAHGRANLSGVDLRGLCLREANLSGANLAKANLAEVDLTAANLSAANLVGAILACANLSGAKLRGAKLDGADLRGADLTGAHLQGVDLSRCTMKSPETPLSQREPSRDPDAQEVAEAAASVHKDTSPEDPQGVETTDTSGSPLAAPLFAEGISYIVT